MTAKNHILATFHGTRIARTAPSYQFDYGQKLLFPDLELPDVYEVHFADAETGDCITSLGGPDGVDIPDQFFQTGAPILAWIFLHEGADDGETVYKITIPVTRRTQPGDEQPSSVEQSAITQAIAALQNAVEAAEASVSRYPKIENGTWRVWNAADGAWTDTHIRAEGNATSISGVTENTNGSLTIAFSNGTSQTTASMRGADGVSPTVAVASVANGTQVTITDKNGDHVFTVQNGSNAAFSIDAVYPVGSIYMSVNSQSPATLFGGTWQQISDTFLLAAGSTYTAGSTGGEATHTLTADEMPAHKHVENIVVTAGTRPWAGSSGTGGTGKYVNLQEKLSVATNDNESAWVKTEQAGGGTAHNNMPPYLAVYVWKRTA